VNVIRNNIQGLDGLAQLLSLRDAGIQPSIGRTLGFSLVEVEKGRAVFEGTPTEMSTTRSAPSMAATRRLYSTVRADAPCTRC
jgi:hypothetical protein